MRDRGITRPGLKAPIAAALALCGAAVVIWGSHVHQTLGIVALAVGSLAMLNYVYAWSLVRRMRRGEHVIGRWTVPSETFDKFRAAERNLKKRKNNWRMPRKRWSAGLPVVFSEDAVLVGDTYFKLLGKGISRFSYVRIEDSPVACIEFSMTVTVIGAGTLSQTARYRGHLRIPIANDAQIEASRVVSHFRQIISG